MGDNRWIITKQGRIDLFRRRNAGDLFDETGLRQIFTTVAITRRSCKLAGLFWPEGVKKAPLSIMSPSDLQFQLFHSSNPVKLSCQVT